MTRHLAPRAAQFARFALVISLGLAAASNAKAAEATYAQRMACTPDAFRLCSSEMPNADAVKACMFAHKADLSPGCRAMFPRQTASR